MVFRASPVPLSCLGVAGCRAELGSLCVDWLSCGTGCGHRMAAGHADHSVHGLLGPPSPVWGHRVGRAPLDSSWRGQVPGFLALRDVGLEDALLNPASPRGTHGTQSCEEEPSMASWGPQGLMRRAVAWGPRTVGMPGGWLPPVALGGHRPPAPCGWAEHRGTASRWGPSLGRAGFGSGMGAHSPCSEFGFISCFQAAARLGRRGQPGWGCRMWTITCPAPRSECGQASVDGLNLPDSEAGLLEGGSWALSLG